MRASPRATAASDTLRCMPCGSHSPSPCGPLCPPSVCGSTHSFSISIPPSSSKYLSRMWKALRLSSNRSSSQSSMKYMFTARLQGQRTMTAHLLPSLLHHSPPPSHHSPPPSHHSHHPPITPTTLPSLSTTLPSLPPPSHHSHHPPITLHHPTTTSITLPSLPPPSHPHSLAKQS